MAATTSTTRAVMASHRLAMPKAALRVRRLTLVPSETVIEVNMTPDDGYAILERERLARITELSVTSSSTLRKLGRVHGVEPKFKSKFWANEDDEDSKLESEDGDTATPTLLKEAEAAGFTVK
jgi:hypothetical protein